MMMVKRKMIFPNWDLHCNHIRILYMAIRCLMIQWTADRSLILVLVNEDLVQEMAPLMMLTILLGD